MSPLETVLVILVSLWTLIFIIITVALIILILWFRSALNKINRILDQGENVARGIGSISSSSVGGMIGLLLQAIIDKTKKNRSKKR